MKLDTRRYLKAKKRGDKILYVDLRSGRILHKRFLSMYKQIIEPLYMSIETYEFITSTNRKITTCADIYDSVRWNHKGKLWIEEIKNEKNLIQTKL